MSLAGTYIKRAEQEIFERNQYFLHLSGKFTQRCLGKNQLLKIIISSLDFTQRSNH